MVNPRQHAPSGEPPPGFHPSQYWDPIGHEQAGKALYGRYVRPGDLVFDIGANVGQRTGWFLEMGCRVVSVEPQLACCEFIPRHSACTVINKAVGAKEESGVPFYICDTSNYLSTLSVEYVDQVHAQPGIAGNMYHETGIEVTTLDALIAEFGEPAFIKIDVEGGEVGVLAGLSQPVTALSFEAHQFDQHKADECVELLDRLGSYHYEYAPLETFRIGPFPPAEWALFGDVYAVKQAA